MSDLSVRLLPHCPNPVQIAALDRATAPYVAEVCGCPRTAVGPVHWTQDDGRQMHCMHGPDNPPIRSARLDHTFLVAFTGASACRPCSQGLFSRHFARRLAVTTRCCYCGGTAEAGVGWSLKKHPALGVPGARR
ncbi:hypothetical protein [Streptomyces sp. NBC_01353]|uniref:hypothetical protein n=1 Tax=Streptomyces sp. NBC_01353 TaxID=2903835 RepID=UPI002E31B3D9|nr:hypothetical protein [Streptomyces sp. NBC_01353]